jgi:hypothetical protein
VEALAHDTIRGLFNTIVSATQLSAEKDGAVAAVLCLRVLCIVLLDSDDHRGGNTRLGLSVYQHLFTHFGMLTPALESIGWTAVRRDIFREIITCISAALKRSTSWNIEQKRQIVHGAIELLTAVTCHNATHEEMLWQVLAQKSRKRLNDADAADVKNSFGYQDFASVLAVKEEDGTAASVTLETVSTLLRMLLGSLPSESTLYLGNGADPPADGFFGSGAEIPRMVNLVAIPLLVSIAPSCEEALQSFILNTLGNFICGSSASCLINLSACSTMRVPLFDLLLEVFSPRKHPQLGFFKRLVAVQ